jgi:NAD(P)-dependent dehydrogenase (short-subunit alcohol dehydrogenase family)
MTMEELNTGVSTMSPLKRPGVPEDVAGLVSLIASPEAQWMTDQTFHCSGGAHMGTA